MKLREGVKSMTDTVLYIVVPCYNEEKVLPITAPMFCQKLEDLTAQGLISPNSRVLFVDDGSSDGTWALIQSLSRGDPRFLGLRQSRNRGHQSSVLAGLMEARERCAVTISIDCDGQDDINAMDEMIRAYLSGSEVVYGVRSSRKTDTFFKRFTAESFYRFLSVMGAEVVFNHADYRLISARVLRELDQFQEVNLFLRGLVPLAGFPSSTVSYERHERLAGQSHYPLKKMLGLAADGVTSLSTKPLELITGLGIFISLLSFAGVIWAVVSQLTGHTVAGWASMVAILCFMGGIQLICLGVIGIYVGKIYMESKHRPRYIISERTDNWND